VRENREGALYTLVYGKPVAIGIGPIEKAPFHHFHPGHRRQTIATVGCNLRCQHCHNWHISQREFEEVRYRVLSPQEVVDGVKRAGLNSVSFTYTEPTVFFEYMYDIAKLAQAHGMKTTLVTNGFINPEPLRALLQHMDAVRVEMTHLPPTPVETLEMAHRIAKEVGINFVTIGNLPGHRYDSTFCPACGQKLIHRVGFSVLANNIEEGRCRSCGEEIPGIWE
jgi:pyruvate-formate lyase-activating enzyme